MVRTLADWIAQTDLSTTFQNVSWLVPTSQSIHIVAVGAVFTAAIMLNARLLGVVKGHRSISQLADDLVPWIWRGLAALVVTGLLQTITEPVRQFVTPVFWAKMSMIIVVASFTATYARVIRRNAAEWESAGTGSRTAKVFAVVSTILWIAIITCGRFIGYTSALYR